MAALIGSSLSAPYEMKTHYNSLDSSSSKTECLGIIPGMHVITAPNGKLVSVKMTDVYSYTPTRRGYFGDKNDQSNYPIIPIPGNKSKYVEGECDRVDRSPIVITHDAPFDASISMFNSWRACESINYGNFGFVSMFWERAPDHQPLQEDVYDGDHELQLYTKIIVWVDPQDKLSIRRIEDDNNFRREEIAEARMQMQKQDCCIIL